MSCLYIKLQQKSHPLLSLEEICNALNIYRSTYYRSLEAPKTYKQRESARKLSVEEEQHILSTLNSERFCDKSPAEIEAILLDEGKYYCSARTMYRILEKNRMSVQRRQSNSHKYSRPELLAENPNQLWSWDITKLRGSGKWQYFYLYKIIDIYSRFVVGWMVADRESGELAKDLIADTAMRQEILPGQLTIHSDRGSSMKSSTVGALYSDLQIRKSFARPHTPNDNPYSESAFKTLKYSPSFPKNFGSIEDARQFCYYFFKWYNTEHRHSGIAMLTPETVHYGTIKTVVGKRQNVLKKAYGKHPERFVRGLSKVKYPDTKVWINKPEKMEQERTPILTN